MTASHAVKTAIREAGEEVEAGTSLVRVEDLAREEGAAGDAEEV